MSIRHEAMLNKEFEYLNLVFWRKTQKQPLTLTIFTKALRQFNREIKIFSINADGSRYLCEKKVNLNP